MSAEIAELQKQIESLRQEIAMLPDYGAQLAETRKEVAANGFSAHKNGTVQNVTLLTATKLTFSTEFFDLNGEFDTSTSRYTPKRPGLYYIVGAVFNVTSVAGDYVQARLYKNGAQVANGGVTHASGVDAIGMSASFFQQANGSTDYFELYTYINRTQNIEGTTGTTAFSGARIGPISN